MFHALTGALILSDRVGNDSLCVAENVSMNDADAQLMYLQRTGSSEWRNDVVVSFCEMPRVVSVVSPTIYEQ